MKIFDYTIKTFEMDVTHKELFIKLFKINKNKDYPHRNKFM
jgi:hypothetical protein